MYPPPTSTMNFNSLARARRARSPKAAFELDSVKDTYADALEVIDFEQPYQLQLQVMGIAECSCTVG